MESWTFFPSAWTKFRRVGVDRHLTVKTGRLGPMTSSHLSRCPGGGGSSPKMQTRVGRAGRHSGRLWLQFDAVVGRDVRPESLGKASDLYLSNHDAARSIYAGLDSHQSGT